MEIIQYKIMEPEGCTKQTKHTKNGTHNQQKTNRRQTRTSPTIPAPIVILQRFA